MITAQLFAFRQSLRKGPHLVMPQRHKQERKNDNKDREEIIKQLLSSLQLSSTQTWLFLMAALGKDKNKCGEGPGFAKHSAVQQLRPKGSNVCLAQKTVENDSGCV